jgi:hypothetical protein
MSEQERQEMRAELELITGWNHVYINSLDDEKLKKYHKERVQGK